MNWTAFWRLWESSAIITGALAIIITIGVVVVVLSGRAVPNELWIAQMSVLSFFFGTKAKQPAPARRRAA